MVKFLCGVIKPASGGPAQLAAVLLLALNGLSAQAALSGRDLDGNAATFEAYYDSDLNISWLADAGLSGALKGYAAEAWAANLSVNGVTGWRLPTTLFPDFTCSDIRSYFTGGSNCSGGEMGHLYQIENISLGTPGPFTGITNASNGAYWSSTRFPAPETDGAYLFYFANGGQTGDWAEPGRFSDGQLMSYYAWAVHDGDVGLVSGVPEPETYALMLAGLGLVGAAAARRKRSV